MNSLNIPMPVPKAPKFNSLAEERDFWMAQKLKLTAESAKIVSRLAEQPRDESERMELLRTRCSLKEQAATLDVFLNNVSTKLRAEKASRQEQREAELTPLVADLLSMALQILDELREINRKLPESS